MATVQTRRRRRPTAGVRLVLASASPTRLAVLTRAGITPQVVVSDVNEDAALAAAAGAAGRALSVTEQVGILARAKAEAVAATLPPDDAPRLVLGCDSLLELDGVAHGKPGTAERATAAWQAMRGREGVLRTGHSLILSGSAEALAAVRVREVGKRQARRRSTTAVSAATVRFADVSDAEIAAYVATGEPLAVAGAFTIDGVGGAFVEGVDGDHNGVLGVSLPLLRSLVGHLGLPYPALWS